MKKILVLALTVILALMNGPAVSIAAEQHPESRTAETDADLVEASGSVPMYRLYNLNTGEHFYTASVKERNYLASSGWNYEGVGWIAPASGSPVYRLYNRNAGDHHYTVSVKERNYLIGTGWKYEGIGWYSGGNIPVYRQYNSHAVSGSHNYTTDKSENDSLVRAGWRSEGIGWRCVGKGYAADQGIDYYQAYHNTLANLASQKIRSSYGSSTQSVYSNLTYTLYDITGDGIKELIVSWRLTQVDATMYFYSYNGTRVSQLDFVSGQSVGRHDEIMPAGKDIVYDNVNLGVVNVARVHWNGSKLTREWVASRKSPEASRTWLDGIYSSLGCGTAFTMYQANDYSLLRRG